MCILKFGFCIMCQRKYFGQLHLGSNEQTHVQPPQLDIHKQQRHSKTVKGPKGWVHRTT